MPFRTELSQLKLLRVLEEKEFERVGSSETLRIVVSIIAATNQKLSYLVKQGHFREDLYYRLNVIPIEMPALREHISDLPLLLEHFLQKYRLLTGKPIFHINDEALELLLHHDYPGNVRELENAIEHAFASTPGEVIVAEKLPPGLRQTNGRDSRSRDHREQHDILQALRRACWHRARAAELLGISRITLWRRMKAHGILPQRLEDEGRAAERD